MEITQEMVTGYATAVAAALEAAGHKVKEPTVDPDELTGEIVIPEALDDLAGRDGLALLWEAGHGWAIAVYVAELAQSRMHTDLRLGVVPDPRVLVSAVAKVVETGSLAAGRVVPGTAELLAAYADGAAPEPATTTGTG